MTTSRLESCYFEHEGPPIWTRMASVLAYSAALHCPAWRARIDRFDPALLIHKHGSQMAVDNTQKFDRWAEIVQASDDGDRLLLIDADTLIARPLDPVWELDFDVAITARKFGPHPLNGGVIFLRISADVKAFFRTWRDVNARMFDDYLGFHREWKKQYGGMNQAALGYLLKREPPNLRLIHLPCEEWNCEDVAWETFDPAITRIIHVKSALRHAIFHGYLTYAYLRPLVTLWHDTESAAKHAPRSVAS